RQRLVAGEDLLHNDPGPLAEALQPLEILLGIGQAVGMVDAQSVDAGLGGEPAEERMRSVEHRLVLGAQRREIGDLEEAPVVDLVGGDAPEREPVMLLLEQAVQRERILRVLRRLQVTGALRAERKALVEIRYAPGSLSRAGELDLAFFQRLAVVPAEDRQQQPAAAALPVDVEEFGVRGGAALFEDVL